MPLAFNDILGQAQAIDTLTRAYAADRLPHGLIFAGPAGVGKSTAARALGALFLCEDPKGVAPCGRCPSCTLMAAGNHPDFHTVYRQLIRLEKEESKARDLTVDVVRQYLIEPANLKPAMHRGKVFVIEEAELMNPQAQNALLKTLEEPYGRTLIVMITDQAGQLLQTIRSRSQTIRFLPLPVKLVIDQLAKRGIAPDVAQDAAFFAEGSLGIALKWIEDGVVDQARELRTHLASLLQRRKTDALPEFYKKSAEAYAAKQIERDELASKDQATREGLAIYFRLTSLILRTELPKPDDPDRLDPICQAIEAIVQAEEYLDANVNIPLVLQQLSLSLERELVG